MRPNDGDCDIMIIFSASISALVGVMRPNDGDYDRSTSSDDMSKTE